MSYETLEVMPRPRLTIRYCRECGHLLDSSGGPCLHCQPRKKPQRWTPRRVGTLIGFLVALLGAAYVIWTARL